MSEISIESYFKSLENFGGEIAQDQISRIQESNKGIEIFAQDELFYAKGMFESVITDKFYFFNETRIRIVEFDLTEKKEVQSVYITENKYSSFDTVVLNLHKDYGVTLVMQLKNDVKIRFNNLNDARGNWEEAHGRQIRAVYNIIKS